MRRTLLKGRERHLSQSASGLVEDSTAFLAGHLAETLERRGNWVPAWTWNNLLAHGTEQDLRADKDIMGCPRSADYKAWREARSYLAGEILDLAATCGPLSAIQEQALQPIEHEASLSPLMEVWSCDEWVHRVFEALNDYWESHLSSRPHDTYHQQ
jgi:hypothetical protein